MKDLWKLGRLLRLKLQDRDEREKETDCQTCEYVDPRIPESSRAYDGKIVETAGSVELGDPE